MRRRALLVALPLAAGVLTACEGSSGDDAAGPVEPVDPAVTRLDRTLDAVDPTSVRLPLEMTVMIVVDPGWSAAPLELEGVLLGFAQEEDALRYSAVAQDGTVLWEARRPLSCTGAALSRGPDDRTVAVLPDIATDDDAIAATTVTAYDLSTADTLWGPTETPGPQAAPGLVFAGTGDEPMGAGGPRRALTAATGEVALTEEELDGGRILAEHLGTVLHTDGADLVATSAADLQELWRLALPTHLDPQQVHITGPIDPNSGLAVVAATNTPGAAVDIAAGRLVATTAEAVARDHVNAVTVVAAGATVQGLDADGAEQWRHEDPEQLALISAGERLAYAQRAEEGSLVVLDTNRGLMVQPYDADLSGPPAVPELFTAEAAAVVRLEGRRLLVTTRFDPEYGTRE